MIELFPNIDHLDVPPGAMCPPAQVTAAMAALKGRLEQATTGRPIHEGVPLLLFETPPPA
jgi:hypothetical protein